MDEALENLFRTYLENNPDVVQQLMQPQQQPQQENNLTQAAAFAKQETIKSFSKFDVDPSMFDVAASVVVADISNNGEAIENIFMQYADKAIDEMRNVMHGRTEVQRAHLDQLHFIMDIIFNTIVNLKQFSGANQQRQEVQQSVQSYTQEEVPG